MLVATLVATAQARKPMNKPYIDLRPMHFGILIGTNFQDIEFEDVGPRTITTEEGTIMQTIVTDADKWNPGFSPALYPHHALWCETYRFPQSDRS